MTDVCSLPTPPNIFLLSGDLLKADAESLVNPINCVGVMGKGLALAFKQIFPANFEAYRLACGRGEVQPGRMFVTQAETPCGLRLLVNFPTKRHFRMPSLPEDIETGLAALASEVQERNLRSLALPALGCGLGGLDWEWVRPRIFETFAALPAVRVLLYVPHDLMPAPLKEQKWI